MPRIYRATWVLPIDAPPMRDAWVAVADGRILALGPRGSASPGVSGSDPASRDNPSYPGSDPHSGDNPSYSGSDPQSGDNPSYLGSDPQSGDNPSYSGSDPQSGGNSSYLGSDPQSGGNSSYLGSDPKKGRSLPNCAILPALVNAHTHLELSWMRGRVPPGQAMPDWAARLIGLRQAAGADPQEPIAAAIDEARATGTGLVGDISNTLASWDALAASAMSAVVFHELIGFRGDNAGDLLEEAKRRLERLTFSDRLRNAIAPHAPYSVSPDLLRAIGRTAGDAPISVHLGESAEELQFLRDGSGPWRALLERVGAWDPSWTAPGCGPVEYLERLGLLDRRLIAVHAAQLTEDELTRLAAADATVVACPRSNAWTGAGVPPIARFYAAHVRVAIGTDSLASADDLNMFAEMAAVRRLAPNVAASKILESATLNGARALGFEADLGSITPGKRAELIAVAIPPDVPDVEEYLLTGIGSADVQWLVD